VRFSGPFSEFSSPPIAPYTPVLPPLLRVFRLDSVKPRRIFFDPKLFSPPPLDCEPNFSQSPFREVFLTFFSFFFPLYNPLVGLFPFPLVCPIRFWLLFFFFSPFKCLPSRCQLSFFPFWCICGPLFPTANHFGALSSPRVLFLFLHDPFFAWPSPFRFFVSPTFFSLFLNDRARYPRGQFGSFAITLPPFSHILFFPPPQELPEMFSFSSGDLIRINWTAALLQIFSGFHDLFCERVDSFFSPVP